MAELDVFVQSSAPYFRIDPRLHTPQTGYNTEINIAAVHEGAQSAHQIIGLLLIAGNRSRLNQRVALPVPALVLIIFFQRVEIVHQRTAVTVRSQAHIDTEYKAFNGHRIQRGNNGATEASKKFFITQRAFVAIGLAGLRIGENQVNIG